MATASFNIEKLIISKIIETGSITEIADIPSDFLDDPKYRRAYEYIKEHTLETGSVPTRRIFRVDQPDILLLPEVQETWEQLIPRIEEQYLKGILSVGLDEIARAFDRGDIKSARDLLGGLSSEAYTALPSSRDVDVSQNGQDRLARYLERRNNPGTLVGIPTGFPAIDRATQGLQPGQLVTLTGLAKASKSTLALRMAMTIQESGYRILYLTYEQTVEEQERRLDSYRAGFNDNLLNSGRVTDEQWDELRKGIHLTENLPPLTISEDCMTVSSIAAKIDILKPHVVIVDGAYMMDDEKGEPSQSAAALTNIVKGLKLLAMRRSICVVAVTQSTPARTKGETLNNDSIMGSRAFIQYSNTVFGIERTDDVKMRRLKILLSRSCVPCEIVLLFDYDTGQFIELEGFDIDDDIDKELADGEGFTEDYGAF